MNVDQTPPKGSIINLVNGQRMDFLVNPDSLEISKSVNYTRVKSPGLGHERLQYSNTSNRQIPLELFMSQHLQDRISGQANSHPRVATERRAFLESLTMPAANVDFGYQGPPKCLFIWPAMERYQGRVIRYEEMHRNFSPYTLTTTVLVVRLTIEEDLDFRMLMEDILIERGELQGAD